MSFTADELLENGEQSKEALDDVSGGFVEFWLQAVADKCPLSRLSAQGAFYAISNWGYVLNVLNVLSIFS